MFSVCKEAGFYLEQEISTRKLFISTKEQFRYHFIIVQIV